MENLREKIKGTLVNNAKSYKKYVSKPRFVSYETFIISDVCKLLMYELITNILEQNMIIVLSSYLKT